MGFRTASLTSFIYKTSPAFSPSHVIAEVFFLTPTGRRSKYRLSKEAHAALCVGKEHLGDTIKRFRKALAKEAARLEKRGYKAFLVVHAHHWSQDIEALKKYKKGFYQKALEEGYIQA